MQRVLFLVLIALLLLLPTSAAFAQLDDDNTTFYDCEPSIAVENLLATVTLITDAESFQEALIYIGEYAINCGEVWLSMLMDGSFFNQLGGMLPPMDGFEDFGGDYGDYGDNAFMNSDTLEYVLLSALDGGDIETANQYLCARDQISEDEVSELDLIEISTFDCTDQSDGTITCEMELTAQIEGEEPETVSQVITFEVVDDVFCSVN